MRSTLLTIVDDFGKHGVETAFAHKVGLRVVRCRENAFVRQLFNSLASWKPEASQKGDRVLFWAGNSPEWVDAFFGCLIRGVIVVPLDAQSAASFAAKVAQQTEPKLLIYTGNHRGDLGVSLPRMDASDCDCCHDDR